MQQIGHSDESVELASSAAKFVRTRQAYYGREFEKIQAATRFPWSWNGVAALAGPFWGASRGLWGYFWTFLILEVLALVQIGRGWWGDLGADKLARLERLTLKSDEFRAKYEAALLAGDPDAASYLNRAENLEKIAGRVAEEAALAAQGATTILLTGLALLIALRLVQGFYANICYEKQYLRWRANPLRNGHAGVSWVRGRSGRPAMAGDRPAHPLPVHCRQDRSRARALCCRLSYREGVLLRSRIRLAGRGVRLVIGRGRRRLRRRGRGDQHGRGGAGNRAGRRAVARGHDGYHRCSRGGWPVPRVAVFTGCGDSPIWRCSACGRPAW